MGAPERVFEKFERGRAERSIGGVWNPDLRTGQDILSAGVLVKF